MTESRAGSALVDALRDTRAVVLVAAIGYLLTLFGAAVVGWLGPRTMAPLLLARFEATAPGESKLLLGYVAFVAPFPLAFGLGVVCTDLVVVRLLERGGGRDRGRDAAVAVAGWLGTAAVVFLLAAAAAVVGGVFVLLLNPAFGIAAAAVLSLLAALAVGGVGSYLPLPVLLDGRSLRVAPRIALATTRRRPGRTIQALLALAAGWGVGAAVFALGVGVLLVGLALLLVVVGIVFLPIGILLCGAAALPFGAGHVAFRRTTIGVYRDAAAGTGGSGAHPVNGAHPASAERAGSGEAPASTTEEAAADPDDRSIPDGRRREE